MREFLRVRELRYSEADVSSIFIKLRETSKAGSFVREIGDFIAHNNRDRGETLSATVFQISQVAFFSKYITAKSIFDPQSDCPWWLKAWYYGKLAEESDKRLKKATGLTKGKAKAKLDEMFPESNQPYPDSPRKLFPHEVKLLTNHFSGYLSGRDIFPQGKIILELKPIFSTENVPLSEISHFLAATAILLNGKTCDIKNKVSVTLQLTTAQEINDSEIKGIYTNFYSPTGKLQINALCVNKTPERIANIGMTLFETNARTQEYIASKNGTMDDVANYFSPGTSLLFERSRVPMVFHK